MYQHRLKDSLATAKNDSSTIGNPEADADKRVMMGNFDLGKGQHSGPFLVWSILMNKMGTPDWFKFMAVELLFYSVKTFLLISFHLLNFSSIFVKKFKKSIKLKMLPKNQICSYGAHFATVAEKSKSVV